MNNSEIAKAIIREMNEDQHYRFFDIWSRCAQATHFDRIQRRDESSLKYMIKKGLIEVIRYEDGEAIVRVRVRGYPPGIKNIVPKIKAFVLRSWKISAFLIGGLIVLAANSSTIYKSELWHDISEWYTGQKPKEQPKQLLPRVSSEKSDSLKMDSIRKHP